MAQRKKQSNKLNKGGFGVILESIDSRFEQLLEGRAATHKEINDFRGEFSDFRGETKFGFKALTERIGKFENKTDGNFKSALEYLSNIDEEIKSIKLELIHVKLKYNDKADKDRLERLEHRVLQVELMMKKFYGKSSN